MNEKTIQSKILLEVGSKQTIRLFRNMVGVGKLQDGSIVRFGLMPGSADLIGWQTVTITPEMVGKKFAVFLSIEVKSEKGKPSDKQIQWQKVVADSGGKAIIAKNVSEIINFLEL
jgi:hypothetical protein